MGPSSASSALGVPLRFLPAHSAAVVGAGLGIDLLLKHVNPAHCFSFGQPYDDDVFKVWRGTPVWRSPKQALGWGPAARHAVMQDMHGKQGRP